MCIYRPWGSLSEKVGESSTDLVPLVFRLKVSSHSLLAPIISITLLYNKKYSFCLDGSRFSTKLIPVSVLFKLLAELLGVSGRKIMSLYNFLSDT